MKRVYPYSLLCVPLLALGCSPSRHPAPGQPPTAQAVLVKSIASSAARRIQTPGTLHAKETATLSAQIPGTVEQVLVQPGDRVHAGQILIRIDGAAIRSALQQATAGEAAAEQQQMAAASQAALAAQTLSRYEQLKAQHSVSPQEFDEIKQRAQTAQRQVAAYAAQRQQATAAVAGARTQLAYTTLRAPFAGIIAARMVDPGTLAAPGLPLLEVDRDGPLQVYASVDESLIDAVHNGMPLPVHVEGLNMSGITGTVTQITPSANAASRSFLIKLNLPPVARLRPGMYATVGLPDGTKTATLIPQSALMTHGALTCVYVLDAQGVAQLRYITTGSRSDGRVEVLSGVVPDETLVDQPGDRNLAGKRIVAASEAHP